MLQKFPIIIRDQPAIVRFASICTLVTCSVVSVVTLLIYPREQWIWEIGVSNLITIFLTFTMGYTVGIQIRNNFLLTEELRRLVERDRLSDAATRDYFFARLSEQPGSYGVSLMVDIDRFKSVNDTFGHLAGDEVIRQVAGSLRRQVREMDIVCRFGGEEFVIFLHEATPEEGWLVAERIRAEIAATEVATEDRQIRVTVSIGGSMKACAEEIDDAIRRADKCLYRAKAGGRDRIVVDWHRHGDDGGRSAA